MNKTGMTFNEATGEYIDELISKITNMTAANEMMLQANSKLIGETDTQKGLISNLECDVHFWKSRAEKSQTNLDAECEWSEAASWDDDTWEGGCGAKWNLEAGGPKENSMNYCPQCGGKLVEAIGEQE